MCSTTLGFHIVEDLGTPGVRVGSSGHVDDGGVTRGVDRGVRSVYDDWVSVRGTKE